MPRIIRVFPRRTRATPDDELSAVCRPPGMLDEADEVDSISDGASALAVYLKLCEEAGLPRPNVLTPSVSAP